MLTLTEYGFEWCTYRNFSCFDFPKGKKKHAKSPEVIWCWLSFYIYTSWLPRLSPTWEAGLSSWEEANRCWHTGGAQWSHPLLKVSLPSSPKLGQDLSRGHGGGRIGCPVCGILAPGQSSLAFTWLWRQHAFCSGTDPFPLSLSLFILSLTPTIW